MRYLILLAIAMLAAASLSACVVVDKPGHGPDHCPPGHHMKGWC
ncbi:MAG TPA: hypothetical protein VIF12_03255 [Micavibrio sp.]